MELTSPQKEIYSRERFSAARAQRLAQEIAFGPVVFQVSRLMLKFGIFDHLNKAKDGLSLEEIMETSGLSRYAAQVLLESSLTIGTVLLKEERFHLAKAGWFLLNDEMARVNMAFNHDVNYLGLFRLEEALQEGKPAGLKHFGDWPTIYEGLSSLPGAVQESWFGFDHFYSDQSFGEALEIVFSRPTKTLLDVGGNTGRWATHCVAFSQQVEVTIMDLPQQLEMMKQQTASKPGADRIHGYAADLLDETAGFPLPFDAIWMSQFLDCFSEEQVGSILTRAACSMTPDTRLYIMETLWDRQRFETASYCLAQISLYFTALANGNSKMFYSGDLLRLIEKAGLEVEEIHDGLGLGHSLFCCRKKQGGNSAFVPLTGDALLALIPQREPMVMVDTFLGLDGDTSYTALTITPENLFCEQDRFQETGIIEHIAQSAAARTGYLCGQKGEPVPTGYIGSVDKMRIYSLPPVGSRLHTEIKVEQVVGDITLISARVKVEEEVVAEGKMKIFLGKA